MENESRRSSEIRRVSCQENRETAEERNALWSTLFVKEELFGQQQIEMAPGLIFQGCQIPNSFLCYVADGISQSARNLFQVFVSVYLYTSPTFSIQYVEIHFSTKFMENVIFINSSTLKSILFSIEFVENYFPLYVVQVN